MPTTSNFGWTTPADTDLVKDGAAAIRTLGNGIDTSLVDLKGGTTGQILSKNSNTDLDYTWINNDQGDITAVTAGTGLTGGGTTGAVTLTNDMATTITAAGDIVVGTGSGTYDNLPIGTTGQVLTADTTVSPYKVKWAAASSGSYVGVAAYRDNSNVTINDATATAIGFPSEEWDTDGFHDNSTNNSRITIPSGKGGKYEFIVTAGFNVNVGSAIQLRLYKNGSVVTGVGQSNGNFAYFVGAIDYVAGTTVASAVAGDYFEIFILQYSAGNSKTLSHARCVVNYLGA